MKGDKKTGQLSDLFFYPPSFFRVWEPLPEERVQRCDNAQHQHHADEETS